MFDLLTWIAILTWVALAALLAIACWADSPRVRESIVGVR